MRRFPPQKGVQILTRQTIWPEREPLVPRRVGMFMKTVRNSTCKLCTRRVRGLWLFKREIVLNSGDHPPARVSVLWARGALGVKENKGLISNAIELGVDLGRGAWFPHGRCSIKE
jgi:hypothetical protein